MLVFFRQFMHYYFPGMIVGIILLQTAIVAPTLFKKLEFKQVGPVIRALWPKFFLLLSVLGVVTLIDLYFHNDPSDIHYMIAGLTVTFSTICYAIIPATNRATDEGNQKRFNLLHKISVLLTVVILLMNIGYAFV